MKKVELKTALAAKGLRLIDLAERLGLNKSTITRWAQSMVPAERVLDVEDATGIAREEIRPDLYRQRNAPRSSKKKAKTK